jgi:hypothetical protein
MSSPLSRVLGLTVSVFLVTARPALANDGDAASLVKERDQIAQRIEKYLWDDYRSEAAPGDAKRTTERVFTRSRRLAEAQRTDKKLASLDAFKHHWDAMKSYEGLVAKWVKDGQPRDWTALDVAIAKFYRLEAECWLRSAEAKMLDKPDPQLKERLALLAKERTDLAREIYETRIKDFKESGRGFDIEDFYLWSRRWTEAQGDATDLKPAKVAAAEQHLARLKELEESAKRLVKEGAREAQAIDVSKARFFGLEAEFLLTQAKGDPQKALAGQRREIAQKVYEATWTEYKQNARPDLLELTCAWSRRWLEAQRDMSDEKTAQASACASHLERVQKLKDITRDVVVAGKSRYLRVVDVDSAAFYVCEARLALLALGDK